MKSSRARKPPFCNKNQIYFLLLFMILIITVNSSHSCLMDCNFESRAFSIEIFLICFFPVVLKKNTAEA
jgi:hypothetical protein